MFKQFCKNLNYYLTTQERKSYRYSLGLMLTDLVNHESNSSVSRDEIATLLYSYREESVFIQKFLFELWGYGYEFDYDTLINLSEIDPNLAGDLKELIELLYGTSYWHVGYVSDGHESYSGDS